MIQLKVMVISRLIFFKENNRKVRFILRNDIENRKFAIFGGSVDKFGWRYEKN